MAIDDFIEKAQADPLRNRIKSAERSQRNAQETLDQAELKLQKAQADLASARCSFSTRDQAQVRAARPYD